MTVKMVLCTNNNEFIAELEEMANATDRQVTLQLANCCTSVISYIPVWHRCAGDGCSRHTAWNAVYVKL